MKFPRLFGAMKFPRLFGAMKLPRFIGSSVRGKTMAVVLATVFAALLVDTLALLVYELGTYREARLDDLGTQAEILGRAVGPALAFDDRKDATADLLTLRARSDILAAAFYTAEGRVFASYAQNPDGPPLPRSGQPHGRQVDADLLRVSRDIVEGGQKVGSVYIIARSGLYERIIAHLGILVTIMGLALGAALLLSLWLQKVLTDPILAIATAARRVVEKGDLRLRAEKTTSDEIGVLADAFNRMLAEVEARQGELRAADRRKDEFLATLAHELRNPLAPIRNALFIMKLAPGDEQAAAQAREMIDRQVTQMVRLVDDLIDVSRVTTGKLALRRERVEVAAVMKSALEAVEPLARAREHSIVTRLPSEPAYLNADPIRLSQVFLNLLNNAVKFTDPGGEIRFECAVHDNELVACVRDNGIGIAPEMLESIFDMFAQADRSLERSTAGLGVGLALSRRLVELHGGTIEAKSAGAGRGSEFVVRIPVPRAQGRAGHARTGAQPAGSPGKSQRILLVDDNEDYVVSLAAVLGAMDHEVRVAHDGASGLEIARKFRPQLAILDIGMPNMNGFELARRLREEPETAGTILVAVTGFSQPSDREQGRRAGFDGYLVKPVEIDRLKEILEKA